MPQQRRFEVLTADAGNVVPPMLGGWAYGQSGIRRSTPIAAAACTLAAIILACIVVLERRPVAWAAAFAPARDVASTRGMGAA